MYLYPNPNYNKTSIIYLMGETWAELVEFSNLNGDAFSEGLRFKNRNISAFFILVG